MAKSRAKKPRLVQLALECCPDALDPPPPGPEIVFSEFEDHPVRHLMIDGNPWWVLTDVARVLGYRDAANAGRVLRDKHKGTHSVSTPSGIQDVTVISEPGLYCLMMRSDRPEAERFQDWIAEEVLPEIRRTGSYHGRTPRLKQLQRQCRTKDANVLAERLDQIGVNKASHILLARQDAKQSDFARWHNAFYEAQFNAPARKLREALNLKGYQSPLDRLAATPLAENRLAKLMSLKIIEKRASELGRNLTTSERDDIARTTMTSIRDEDFARLGGAGAGYALVDNRERGSVIDLIWAAPPTPE